MWNAVMEPGFPLFSVYCGTSMLRRRFGPEVGYRYGNIKLKNMGKERNGGDSGQTPVDPNVVNFGGAGGGGPDSDSRPVDSRVARRRQDPIGRRLRKFYEDVVEESIPDDFLSILEDADGKQARPAGGIAGGELTEAAEDDRSSPAER
jgi:hypothetical protein